MSRTLSTSVTTLLCIAAIIVYVSPLLGAGEPQPRPAQYILDDAPPGYTIQFEPRHPAPHAIPTTVGHYTQKDWAAIIDSVWGPGQTWSEHLATWNSFWAYVEIYFACFPGLDPNIWDDVSSLYGAEIADTVSKGRLCAIINHACLALRESHTVAYDEDVVFSALDPGVPLLIYGIRGNNDHFGAALTVTLDTNLLVYKAMANHPLGLVPGDLVLGYDGTPWKDIYPDLIAAQLPMVGSWWGSADESFDNSFLVAAGLNWHLFDTIDVVRYATGDTLHLPTSALEGQALSCWGTEQMEIPGVPMPNGRAGQTTTWGIVEGTNIGYIYSQGWFPTADSTAIINTWLTALDSLQNEYNAIGVIMDFRTNYGANFSGAGILAHVFDSSMDIGGFRSRCGGHFDLCTDLDLQEFVTVTADTSSYWDRPIAILTGPGAVSGGDFYPMMLSMHPMAKVFGRTSSCAFNGVTSYSISGDSYYQAVSTWSAFLTRDSSHYITRDVFPDPAYFPWLDYEQVWLTQEGVAEGRDDVVEAAIEWILSRDLDQDGVVNESDNCPDHFNPGQEDADVDGLGDACECNVLILPMTGDVDESGARTSSDIIYLVNYVFKGAAEPMPCAASGDVTCDSSVTSADIIHLVNHVFKGGPDPCDVCTLIDIGSWTCP